MGRYPQPSPDEILALPETFRGQVMEDWIDLMGHMNVMWYTHSFSHALVRFLELIGTRLEESHSAGIGTVALEIHVRYLREMRLGEEFRVHSRILGLSAKRYHSINLMLAGAPPRLVATSEHVGAFFDLKARRQRPIPEDIAAKARTLLSEHEQLPWSAPVTGRMGP